MAGDARSGPTKTVSFADGHETTLDLAALT